MTNKTLDTVVLISSGAVPSFVVSTVLGYDFLTWQFWAVVLPIAVTTVCSRATARAVLLDGLRDELRKSRPFA
jgi:hypothetical protein